MQINKRGRNVALLGLLLQSLLVVLAIALWYVSRCSAAWPALWVTIAPLPIWLLTVVLFHARFLARREEHELEQINKRGGLSASIFQGEDGGASRVAANRVHVIEKWFVTVVTVVVATNLVSLGLLFLKWLKVPNDQTLLGNASACMFFAVGGAFVAFLFSRYATGMAKNAQWQLLRAPGSFMFTNSMVLLALGIALFLDNYNLFQFERGLAWALPILMVVVGVEMYMNRILDLYRPRVPGVERRFSYDSRLLNLIASPESITHSIAETLNYQFGFEVSGTWFYKLLQKALVPLVVAGALILWLLTGVVVVDEGQQYIVLHRGQPQYPPLEARATPHFIWPWPIDTVRRYDTSEVKQLVLGVGGERKDETVAGKPIYLWSQEHGNRQELDTLLAVPPRPGSVEGGPPSVNLLKLVIGINYRIKDAYKWGLTYTTTSGGDEQAPEKLLEAIAYRQMVTYAASATLDEKLPEGSKNRPEAIMTFGQERAAGDLRDRIARAAEQMNLGVEIVSVQVLACHPPKDAAIAFEKVIAAEREQDKQRFEAQADANKALAAVAGSPQQAMIFAQALGIAKALDDLARLSPGDEFNAGLQKARAQAAKELKFLQDESRAERTAGRTTLDERGLYERLIARQVQHLQTLEELKAEPAKLEELAQKALDEQENLLSSLTGSSAVAISEARAERWKKELRERARAETFDIQLAAMQQAPDFYRLDRYLDAMSQGLKGVRKYVLGFDRKKVELWLNVERQQSAPTDIPIGEKK